MNEFEIIRTFFQDPTKAHAGVILGIGDDAACLKIPNDHELLVTTDTLVENVHFITTWDPYDIAWKAVMVNLSDIAAMGGKPCFASLALTLPKPDLNWLARFSEGFHAAVHHYEVTLIGGDLTKGPLSLTLTMQGIIPEGKAVKRSSAKPGDSIWVSGELGGAALALIANIAPHDKKTLMNKLLRPIPRLDLQTILQTFASSAIDISDGLGADLGHICEASRVGASLYIDAIPLHPLLQKYQKDNAAYFALIGGDDYELCFTIPHNQETSFIKAIKTAHLSCYKIGLIEPNPDFHLIDKQGKVHVYTPQGYQHF